MMRRNMLTVGVWITISCLGLHYSTAFDNPPDNQHDSENNSKLSEEIIALRSDIKELRAEINRLVAHLQSDRTTPTPEQPKQTATVPPVEEQVKHETDSSFVKMTLEDCIAMALRNTGLHGDDSEHFDLLKNVHDGYWDLWAATKCFHVARTGRDNAADLWRLTSDRAADGELAQAETQFRALYNQFALQASVALQGSRVPGNDPHGLHGREMQLRQKIGWDATDGRHIDPIDLPGVAPLGLDWETVRREALQNNPTIRKIRSERDQLETELLSAKSALLPQLDVGNFYRWLGVGDEQARTIRPSIGTRRALWGIQDLETKINRLNVQLREAETSVLHELSVQWRNAESNYMSIKALGDQVQANVDEIKIYREKVNKGDKVDQILDNLLRAEQRRVQAESQYFKTIGEYHKSVFAIKWLSGSIRQGDQKP